MTATMKSAWLLGGQLVINSLTGYAFQKLFAFYYGPGVEKTVFDIAFSVPMALIYLSGFGFTHAAVVSLFVRLRAAAHPDIERVFASLLNASLALLVLFVTATALLSSPAAQWLAPGLTVDQRAATQRLILWMLPLALTFGVSSYLSAIAAAWRLPIGQEVLLLVGRLAVIAWVLAQGQAVPLVELAAVLLIATVLSLALQWHFVLRMVGLRYRLRLHLRHPQVSGAVHQFGGFMLVALVAQAAAAYARRKATLTGAETVALLGFATALIEPLGAIVGKVLAFQVGQRLAAGMLASDRNAVFSDALRTLTLVFALGTVGAILLGMLAEPLVQLLFGGGEFDRRDVERTALFLRVMAVGLPPAVALWVVLYPLIGTHRHAATLVYVVGYSLQIVFVYASFPALQANAIPWAYVAGLWIQAAAGCAMLWLWKRQRPALERA